MPPPGLRVPQVRNSSPTFVGPPGRRLPGMRRCSFRLSLERLDQQDQRLKVEPPKKTHTHTHGRHREQRRISTFSWPALSQAPVTARTLSRDRRPSRRTMSTWWAAWLKIAPPPYAVSSSSGTARTVQKVSVVDRIDHAHVAESAALDQIAQCARPAHQKNDCGRQSDALLHCAAASMIAVHSSSVSAIGFSTSRCLRCWQQPRHVGRATDAALPHKSTSTAGSAQSSSTVA